LTALILKAGGGVPENKEEAARLLGLPFPFVEGFIDAWDGKMFKSPPLGWDYADGVESALETLRLLREAGYDI
jgi:hypothetical protein